jgi:hypothetical protein
MVAAKPNGVGSFFASGIASTVVAPTASSKFSSAAAAPLISSDTLIIYAALNEGNRDWEAWEFHPAEAPGAQPRIKDWKVMSGETWEKTEQKPADVFGHAAYETVCLAL